MHRDEHDNFLCWSPGGNRHRRVVCGSIRCQDTPSTPQFGKDLQEETSHMFGNAKTSIG